MGCLKLSHYSEKENRLKLLKTNNSEVEDYYPFGSLMPGRSISPSTSSVSKVYGGN